MPQFCAAFGCTNNSSKTDCKAKNISFHRFPLKEPDRLKKWLMAMKREHFVPSIYSVLCSEHFNKEDFDISYHENRRFVKNDAVPSTFNFSKASKRKKLSKRSNSPPSQKKYISITVDRTHCNPTQTSYIHGNRFVPILPRPIRTPISISHNAVPSQFNCLSPGNETGKIQNRDHQNKEQTTHKAMEPNDKIVPFEPEIILKIDNDVTLTCLEETEELDKTVNDPDNSSYNTNAKPLSSEEILKQKLEDMTTLYERTQKKLKLSQEQCKRYAKQIMSLEEIIDNLRQIISVSDFN